MKEAKNRIQAIFHVLNQGILKGKYHCTVDLLFDWFGLVCFANKHKNCRKSKPVKQEVNGTVILPPLVFPGLTILALMYVSVWPIPFYNHLIQTNQLT
jgi:hypothetical protein